MLKKKSKKSIFRHTNRKNNIIKKISNMDKKKYILASTAFIGLLIIVISYSLAALTPTPSITIPSTTLSYEEKEEGSWQFTKTAKWISKGKARINIKLDTIEKKKNDYNDVILVLDTSASMVGDKIVQVQKDVNELIDDTIPKGNKIALIAFNDFAEVITGFTDDASLLKEGINNLTVSGETNYYRALEKVDDVLSTYEKIDNRDCVLLFLTDGLPNAETPLEVGEYKYLKNKYSYLGINGIQYELGDEILDGIKNITDVQYHANRKSLNEFLYIASLFAVGYDKFILTDYVDTNYFNLKNISDINTTLGKAKIVDNKIVWDLNGLRSGANAELTMDINLNEDLVGVGGIYPTHTNTDVTYEMETISTTETTTKTTVLQDKYTVNYVANAPSDCIISNVPSPKAHFVFDTVKIDDSIPTCQGYQFKEWKIATKDVEMVGKNQFIMPEKNVTIRAVWKKLGVNKSMKGKIVKQQTLYELVADNSIGLDTNVDFNSNPTDDNSGVYTIAGTEKDKYPVHYYRGNIDDNNVLFAGFCWKMVRTTSTGGVKLIYNGLSNSYVPIKENEYINISNNETYPYTYDSSTNKWTNTNRDTGLSSAISFSVAESGTYKLSYNLSSKENYDKVYFYKDGIEIGTDTGINISSISLGDLTSSNVITVEYGGSSAHWSTSNNSITFSVDKDFGDQVKSCDNTGKASQISENEFNEIGTLAGVGYMYGTIYKSHSLELRNQAFVLDFSYMGTGSSYYYYYGTSITYSNGIYTLQNAEQKSWATNYNDLIGYYTCQSKYDTGCQTVYYVAGSDNKFMYTINLSSGVTDPGIETITLGKGMKTNEDGTYSLTDTVQVKKKDWYTNHSTYNKYYMCEDLASTTCDNIYIASSTDVDRIIYEGDIGWVYGNDVTWDGTKYTLKDTYISNSGWYNDRNTAAKKYHYTCLNTTGECTDVYYIHNFSDSSTIEYLTLSSGKNIEDAKNEIFTNTTDSTIKQAVDSWYKENMILYTEKLEDTPWCNDRTIAGGALKGKDEDVSTGIFNSHFSSYERNHITNSPSVICSNESRDGFTVSTANGGNGKLTYPVGLLTADEVLLAGAASDNNNYYLYTGIDYWPLGSGYYTGAILNSFVTSGGNLSCYYISGEKGVRPSVSLAPGTKATDGLGTFDDPYIIE